MTQILTIILITINFFGILPIPYTLIFIVILYFVFIKAKTITPYRLPMRFFSLGIILSFIPAFINRDQGLIHSITTSAVYFYMLFFYVLLKFNPSIKQIESVLIKFSIIASGLYIIQYVLFPMGVFILPIVEERRLSDSIDGQRFRIFASGIYSLVYFFSLNKYIIERRTKYIAIAFINVVPIILMGFRTMLGGIALFSVIILLKFTIKRPIVFIRYVLLALMVFVAAYQIPAVQGRVDYMIEKQSEGSQTFADSDYIRWITFDYYTNEYPINSLDRILGSGPPSAKTDFGKIDADLNEQRGITWVDWGLVGLCWILGPLTVISMLWLNFKAIKIVPNEKYFYIKMWFIYLIVVSFTTMEYFRMGNFIIQSLALYIAYKASLEERQLKS